MQPSPDWTKATPPGPDTRVKITEEYAKLVGRDAYFWAWPMVNIFNRRLHFKSSQGDREAGAFDGSAGQSARHAHRLCRPDERSVACPNQDVVYGIGALALDVSPVVIQVPDFGDRFWVYQVVDLAHR